MTQTGQDQHLKLSPQSYVLFSKVFFDKKYSKLSHANIHGRNSLNVFRKSFFSDAPLEVKGVSQQKGGSWYCVYIYKMCPKYAQTLSKGWDDWQDNNQMPKIVSLPKAANYFSRHCCLPKFHLMKFNLDILICCFKF